MPMKKSSTLNVLTKFIENEEKRISDCVKRQEQHSGPTETVLQSILGYSKALRINESESMGQVELVMN